MKAITLISRAVGAALLIAALAGAQDAEPVSRRDLLLRAARNQVQARALPKAVAYYREYLADWPNDAAIAAEFAGVLVQAGQPDEAEKILRPLVEKDPNHRKAVNLLVDVALIRKDYPLAVSVLEPAVQRDPGDAALRRRLAEVYTWSERHDDAVRQYRFLLTARPGDADLEKRLLDALYWGRRYDDYLAESEKVLRKRPNDFAVRLTRVDLFAARRDFAAAAQECRQILALDPNHRAARARLAQFLSWLGEHEQAVKAYEDALAAAPSDLALRREYGQVLLWVGRYKDAVALFRKLHADLPRDETVTREYLEAAAGVDALEETETKEIRALYETRFLKGAPLQPATQAALARAMANAGFPVEALEVFARALQGAPQNAVLRLQYADLLAAQGRADEAEEQYRLLLEQAGKVEKKSKDPKEPKE